MAVVLCYLYSINALYSIKNPVALYSALETNIFFKKVVFSSNLEVLRAKLGVKIMKYDIGETTSKIFSPMFEEN